MLATSFASSRPEKPSVAAAASWTSSGVMPRSAIASGRADRPRRNAVSRPSSPFCAPAPAPPAGHNRHQLLDGIRSKTEDEGDAPAPSSLPALAM